MSESLLKRPGLTRADVLVLAGMLGITLGLTGCVSKAREAANRISCINNLKQMALGLHVYTDTQPGLPPGAGKGAFPTEASGTSVFVTLLPFIEQVALYESMQKGGKAQDVKIYLCPSRRVPPTGGRGDYGYGASVGGVGTSVLDAAAPVSLKDITTKDGVSSTLLLGHKGINTDMYNGSGKNDTAWNLLEHARDPGAMFQDCPSTERNLSGSIGGPHPNVCPAAWCDGHVSALPYNTTTMPQFWAYNDGAKVTPP